MTREQIVERLQHCLLKHYGLQEYKVGEPSAIYQDFADEVLTMLAAERERVRQACADVCAQHYSCEGIAEKCHAAILALDLTEQP